MDKLQTGARYTSSANPGPTYLIVKLTPTRVTVTSKIDFPLDSRFHETISRAVARRILREVV